MVMNRKKAAIIITLWLLIFLTCFSCLGGNIKEPEITGHKDPGAYKWYVTTQPEKAAALVIHGLNTKPERMIPIIDILMKNGISALNLALTGHRGIPAEIIHVSREIWKQEITRGFEFVHAYADRKHLPVLFTGFSLGCAAGLDTACTGDTPLFDYALLFAPALTVRWYTHCVKMCSVFGGGFLLPSKTPPAYRANNGTSVAAYNTLFCHIRTIRKADCESINVPCLCFIDPADELISYTRLLSFVQEKEIYNWNIIPITKDNSTAKETYHHLIIDRESTGEKTWNFITTKISLFLSEKL
jgi:esterase/lipase